MPDTAHDEPCPSDVVHDPDQDYAHVFGSRLRAIRAMHGLTLHGVEVKSGGRWMAGTLGSYERGHRAMTVAKLAELANFYDVGIEELLPDRVPSRDSGSVKLVIDLHRVATMPADRVGPLARYAAAIQSDREGLGNKMLDIRPDDMRSLATIYGIPPETLTKQLVAWGVLGHHRELGNSSDGPSIWRRSAHLPLSPGIG